MREMRDNTRAPSCRLTVVFARTTLSLATVLSLFVTGSTRCDAACTGACVACTAAKKGSGADGACGAIAAGTDPDTECNSNCRGATLIADVRRLA